MNVDSSSQDWWDSLKNEMEKGTFTKETMSDLYSDLFSSLGHQRTSGQGAFHKKFLQVRRLLRVLFCDTLARLSKNRASFCIVEPS